MYLHTGQLDSKALKNTVLHSKIYHEHWLKKNIKYDEKLRYTLELCKKLHFCMYTRGHKNLTFCSVKILHYECRSMHTVIKTYAYCIYSECGSCVAGA